MLSSKDFLVRVMEIAAEEPGYQKGHSGDDNLCDCIGLVIGALSRCGVKWPGIHGSNWAARNALVELKPIRSISDLSSGELVFKHYSPGQSGYDLPDRYNGHPDRLDYYHVGVVASVNPLRISHMTKPSPKQDTSLGKWSHHGWLKMLDPTGQKPELIETGKESAPMSNPIVIKSANGAPVKLRKMPSTTSATWWEIESGTQGTLFNESGAWSNIEAPDTMGKIRNGWMQSKFISEAPTEEETCPQGLTLEQTNRILEILAEMEKSLDDLYGILGGRG